MSSSSIAGCLSRQSDHGQIQIIFGPMFSGKTTELMRRMKRYQIANYRCLIIKYAKDTRYDENGIATHDRQVLPAIGAETLSELQSQALHYDIIGIDEGQFFPDIVTFSDKMAEQGKIVIVAALDGTFQKKGFGNILDLVPLAESIVKLSAVCTNCFREGYFTKRIAEAPNEKGEIIQIGGADQYMAACRQCFYSPPKKSRSPLKALNNTSVNSVSKSKKSNSPSKALKTEINQTVADVENAVKQLF